jgi:hypothetical protein
MTEPTYGGDPVFLGVRARVAADVRAEEPSPQATARQYGVAFEGRDNVDDIETARLRAHRPTPARRGR